MDDSATPSHRLSEVSLFAHLSPTILDWLASKSRIRRYPPGQILCQEGDPGESLIVLEEGQLRISRFTVAGDEAVLAVIEPPAAVGELALLDGAPRDATITAQRAVSVRLIPRSVFQEVLAQEPAMVDGLLRALAGWVRASNARHADMLGLDVPGRLAKWLLARAEAQGEQARAGSRIALNRSQGELAAELGTTRSTLNRTLQSFESLGLLTSGGDHVVLLKPDRLRAYTT
jgi:CRP-like cAMP-binding protein